MACGRGTSNITARLAAWEATTLAPLNVPRGLLDALLDATILHLGERGTLEPLVRRLRACEAVRIVTLGASITFGHGLHGDSDAWPALLQAALRSIWKAPAVITNSAIAATSAPFAALCLDVLVPRGTDAVLIEYGHTSNSEESMAPLIDAVRSRGWRPVGVDYQHLVRPSAWRHHLAASRAHNPHTPHTSSCAETSTRMNITIAHSEQRATTCIPSPRLLRRRDRQAGAKRAFVTRGLPLLSSSPLLVWMYNASATPAPTLVDLERLNTPDGMHASGVYHRFLAAMVVRALWRVTQQIDIVRKHEPPERSRGHELTTWLTNDTEERGAPSGAGVCSIGAALEQLRPAQAARVTRGAARGTWLLLTEKNKTGLVATTPGSELRLRVELPWQPSSAASSAAPSTRRHPTPSTRGAPSPHVYLTYLRSYEHMGQARLSCVGGCTCTPTVYDAHANASRVSLSETGPPVALHEKSGRIGNASACTLLLRVLASTRSGEHKFKLTALTVAPVGVVSDAGRLNGLIARGV